MAADDVVLDDYRDWLNDVLFDANKDESHSLVWLGGGRWALFAVEDVFVISLERGKVEVA